MSTEIALFCRQISAKYVDRTDRPRAILARTPGRGYRESSTRWPANSAGTGKPPAMPSSDETPFFHVALNLPHAGRIARRIFRALPAPAPEESSATTHARQAAWDLVELLDPCLDLDENPEGRTAILLRDGAATLGRQLVDHIEESGLGHDRLGQAVRNLFECLELGREGARLSLRAGEDPQSFQRPV
jgi:hypothetical protein